MSKHKCVVHLRLSIVHNWKQRWENYRSFSWFISLVYLKKLDSSCFAKLLLFYAKIGFTKEWDKQHHFVGVCSGWLGMWLVLGRGKKRMNSFWGWFCGEKALNPHPQCGINFSLPPKLSKDCFSPLEGWWVKQQQNSCCALSPAWLNFSQRTSFCPWLLCLSLVK